MSKKNDKIEKSAQLLNEHASEILKEFCSNTDKQIEEFNKRDKQN